MRAARALPAVAMMLGCAAVIGVPDVQDAAALLCVCPVPNKLYGDHCTATLRSRLDAAPAAEREAWLAGFVQDNCVACAKSAACFERPPTCIAVGSTCEGTAECCDSSKGRECRAGTCQ